MNVEIIGSWIWCFNSYAYRDRLKALGFKFAPKKKDGHGIMGSTSVLARKQTLTVSRAKYGSQKVTYSSKQYSLN